MSHIIRVYRKQSKAAKWVRPSNILADGREEVNVRIKGVQVDRRTLKTKKAIRMAFLALLGEKDVSRIGIKELTDVAEISRKTFYAHYAGPVGILDEIEDEVVSRLEDELAGSVSDKEAISVCTVFEKLTRLILEDFSLFERLLPSNSGTRLPEKIIAILKPRILANLSDTSRLDNGTLNRAADFVAAGAMSVYLQWFGSDRTTPIKDIADTIGILAMDGMNRLMEGTRLVVRGREPAC